MKAGLSKPNFQNWLKNNLKNMKCFFGCEGVRMAPHVSTEGLTVCFSRSGNVPSAVNVRFLDRLTWIRGGAHMNRWHEHVHHRSYSGCWGPFHLPGFQKRKCCKCSLNKFLTISSHFTPSIFLARHWLSPRLRRQHVQPVRARDGGDAARHPRRRTHRLRQTRQPGL